MTSFRLQTRGHHRTDRGAILVLTSIAMIVLMAFTAFAVDLGQRNQQLAAAQHAIDASVLTAAEYLGRHPGDYTGAAKLVKQLIRQNLGIATGDWASCTDDDHLPLSAVNDTNCISFKPIAATSTANEKYDIRVKLPNFKMRTVFGSALGIDTIDLAATAASNGTNCPLGMVCTDGPAASTTSTTARVMTPEERTCRNYTTLVLSLDDTIWATCSKWFPNDDRAAWQLEFCTPGTVTFLRNGDTVPESWAIGDISRYVWNWGWVCSRYISVSVRDGWIRNTCANDLPTVYSDATLWGMCKLLIPGLQSMAGYNATTTTSTTTTTIRSSTSAPTTSTQPTTTAGVPGGTTPTSIDISG